MNNNMNFHADYDFDKNRCLIEQYKIYLEMLEGSTKRRMDTNTFFITINALMATLTSLFNKGNILAIALVCVTGGLFSWIWYVLLRNYNVVNRAKWDVVNEMEAHLQCDPFNSEYPKMLNDKYRSISVKERWLPILFAVVYVAIFVIAIVMNRTHADLATTVAELQESVSELTADLARIALKGIGS